MSVGNYSAGYGLNLSGTTFIINDLSDNITMLSGNQTISGIKTFTENIVGNLSGNATSVIEGLTTNSEITDLSGIISMGSGKIITDAERTIINNISGVPVNVNYFVNPIATSNTSGVIQIGQNLNINSSGVLSNSGGSNYSAGYGLNLSGTTFSIHDLSDNITMLSGNQTISGIKTFNETIMGNLSGNATSVNGGLTTNSEITDLSGIISMGSGKIITDTERTIINNISGVPVNVNYFVNPIATSNTSGVIQIGQNLNINSSGVLSMSVGNYSAGYGLNLSGTTFIIHDLSDNITMLSGTQTINGIKTFSENIVGNLSGNATSVIEGLNTSNEITDLSGITSTGSGKIITDAERLKINSISGVLVNVNDFILPIASTTQKGGIMTGKGFNVNASGILNVNDYNITDAASDTILGGFKVDVSSNLLISNSTLDVKLPIIYTDTLGTPTNDNKVVIQTINSNSETSIHSYTFHKPANCIINCSWSGRYTVDGFRSDVYQLRFKVECTGITTQESEYHVQRWANARSKGTISATLSGVSYYVDDSDVKSYSGDVTVNVMLTRTVGADIFEIFTSQLKILMYN